jgi:penicillin-binding protein 2
MFKHEERGSKILKPFHKRLLYLLIFIFALFILIIFRLSFLQIVNGYKHSEEALSTAQKSIPILAPRGKIYPREGGTPIADNYRSMTAVFTETPEMDKEDFVELALKLEPVLGMTRDDILKKMDVGYAFKKDEKGNYVYDKDGKPVVEEAVRSTFSFLEKDIKMNLSDKEVAYLSEHRLDFKGVEAKVKHVRTYDKRLIAVQAVGYVRPYYVATNMSSAYLNSFYPDKKDIYTPNQPVGFDGVEFTYEEYLRGVNGKRNFQISSNGTIQNELEPDQPIPGNDVYLTIDSRMQLEIRDYIKNIIPSLQASSGSAGTRNVYAVAMEVKTGKIVSMISYPEYDPNLWVSGMSQELFDKYFYYFTNGTIQDAPYDVSPKEGKEANAEIERHPRSIVPSGSTIKPATVLMAISEGIISPNDVWQDPAGGYRYARSATDIVRNDKGKNYGTLTPIRALQKSSNTYMARIGHELYKRLYNNNRLEKNTIHIWQKYMHALGLGVKTGVPLPNESTGVEDFVTTNKTISPLAAIVQASFGQQGKYTAMQLAQYTATLANKGIRMQPQIVEKIVDPNGKVIKEIQPKVLSKLDLPDEAWKTVEDGMYAVTQGDGTASWVFNSFPYKFAAKTGTSDQDIYYKDENGKSQHRSIANGVFIAYGPIGDPKLAVAVVVPEGGYGVYSGGSIAQQIFKSYDKYYGLGSSTNKEEK